MKAPHRSVTAVAGLVLMAVLTSCGGTGRPPNAAEKGAAGAFLSTYVGSDGRVTRHDKSDDTVSEGQAYALLLAEVDHNTQLFQRIWAWTQQHLQLPDHLFASHATATGQIISKQPASGADLLIAWALLRYKGPSQASIHTAGRDVAQAILRLEVTKGPNGEEILTAGPWATGRPAVLNPSYWSLRAMTSLAQLTGQQEWNRLAASAVTLTAQLTDRGHLLPPDWAQLTKAGAVVAAPAPDTHQDAQYGLEAQRLVVWFAASCHPASKTLAASWWRILRPRRLASALAASQTGSVLTPGPSVLPLVASAAAAKASGDEAASNRLLRSAVRTVHHRRTYYGSAWNALGQALLNTDLLGKCR